MAMRSYQTTRASWGTKEPSFTSLAPKTTTAPTATLLDNSQKGGLKGEALSPVHAVPSAPSVSPQAAAEAGRGYMMVDLEGWDKKFVAGAVVAAYAASQSKGMTQLALAGGTLLLLKKGGVF